MGECKKHPLPCDIRSISLLHAQGAQGIPLSAVHQLFDLGKDLAGLAVRPDKTPPAYARCNDREGIAHPRVVIDTLALEKIQAAQNVVFPTDGELVLDDFACGGSLIEFVL